MKTILTLGLLFLPLPCLAAEKPDEAEKQADTQANRLPQPHYKPQSSDPAWLASVVQFHGHLGPSVVAGARMGMIGLRGRGQRIFRCGSDLRRPTRQAAAVLLSQRREVATGATLGKRNLQWVQANRLTMRIKNTRTGKAAVLRPTPALLELLASFKPQPKAGAGHDNKQLEAIARKIAAMTKMAIAVVERNPWSRISTGPVERIQPQGA